MAQRVKVFDETLTDKTDDWSLVLRTHDQVEGEDQLHTPPYAVQTCLVIIKSQIQIQMQVNTCGGEKKRYILLMGM